MSHSAVQNSSPNLLKRARSLVYSIYDGFFYSCMVGLSETYFLAYAIFLGATGFQLAVLSCFPQFLGGMSQFFSPLIYNKTGSNKKVVMMGIICQGLSLIPIFLAYYFGPLRIEFYISVVTCYYVSGTIIAPLWNSWMGGLLPDPQKRGPYFGRRNQIVTVGSYITMTLGGFILRWCKDHQLELEGFGSLFVLAFIFRLFSVYFMSRKTDYAHIHPAEMPKKSIFHFMKELPQKNYSRLIAHMCFVNFAVFLSAAYYTPLMLREHKFDYTTFIVIISGVSLFKFLTFSFWAKLCDRWGAKNVILFCTGLMIFNTLPWMFTKNPYLLFLSQAFGGFGWAGYELGTLVFLLNATSPYERTQAFSTLNICISITTLLGGLLGGALFDLLPKTINNYNFLFTMSSGIRLLALVFIGLKLTPLEPVLRNHTSDKNQESPERLVESEPLA